MPIVPFARPLGLFALVLTLGACAQTPFGRGLPIVAAPQPAPAGPQQPGMTGAEAACIQAGRERGLDVLGVVSTRDVTGADGAPERDVLLRVARDGTQLEVRCSYQPQSGLARIMLI